MNGMLLLSPLLQTGASLGSVDNVLSKLIVMLSYLDEVNNVVVPQTVESITFPAFNESLCESGDNNVSNK